MTHPASAGLRELADWLDTQGAYISRVGLDLRLAEESPKTFAIAVRDTSAKVHSDLDHTVFAHGQLFGLKTMVIAEKSRIGRKQIVTREEFVVGGES